MEYRITYIDSLKHIGELCDKLKEDTVRNYYLEQDSTSNPDFCHYPHYRQRFDLIKRISEICDLFGVKNLEENKNKLMGCIRRLNDTRYLAKRKEFEDNINSVKNIFQDSEKEINEKLSFLSRIETKRLDEAIHCYFEGCNNSTVAMAISAIESRLLYLMKSAQPKEKKLDEMTLGTSISEYLDNKDKYSNVIPKRHEPLLELSNTYEIFSVHPKKETVARITTTTVLSSTLEFLLDSELIETPKESKSI
ncbi:MAG: hypothetical protein GKB99_05080 [Methanocellales archaeon]|nr:hypothetical protein [Methanocellales archaeon]